MTGSRREILARVRRALEGAPGPPRVEHEYGVATPVADVAALFAERVEDYRAVVDRVSAGGVAAAVADALSGATRVVVPPGLEPEWLVGLAGVEVVTDDGSLTPDELDAVDGVVTAAALGVAVTGTVVLDHGPDQGRRALSLVPDLHVCVVRESQLVGDVPETTARLRESVRAGRPLTWVSGPSATSDIELERVEGVHGPRRLHVLLVGGA